MPIFCCNSKHVMNSVAERHKCESELRRHGIVRSPLPRLHNQEIRVPVRLNVYSLSEYNHTLHRLGMGIFHSGIVIYGIEWGYGEAVDNPNGSGLFCCPPGEAVGVLYKSILLGQTTCSPAQVDTLLHRLENEWRSCDYHILHRNCNHFAQKLCDGLSTMDRLVVPGWCNRAARLSDKVFPRGLAKHVYRMLDSAPPRAPPPANHSHVCEIPDSVIPHKWYLHPSIAQPARYCCREEDDAHADALATRNVSHSMPNGTVKDTTHVAALSCSELSHSRCREEVKQRPQINVSLNVHATESSVPLVALTKTVETAMSTPVHCDPEAKVQPADDDKQTKPELLLRMGAARDDVHGLLNPSVIARKAQTTATATGEVGSAPSFASVEEDGKTTVMKAGVIQRRNGDNDTRHGMSVAETDKMLANGKETNAVTTPHTHLPTPAEAILLRTEVSAHTSAPVPVTSDSGSSNDNKDKLLTMASLPCHIRVEKDCTSAPGSLIQHVAEMTRPGANVAETAHGTDNAALIHVAQTSEIRSSRRHSDNGIESDITSDISSHRDCSRFVDDAAMLTRTVSWPEIHVVSTAAAVATVDATTQRNGESLQASLTRLSVRDSAVTLADDYSSTSAREKASPDVSALRCVDPHRAAVTHVLSSPLHGVLLPHHCHTSKICDHSDSNDCCADKNGDNDEVYSNSRAGFARGDRAYAKAQTGKVTLPQLDVYSSYSDGELVQQSHNRTNKKKHSTVTGNYFSYGESMCAATRCGPRWLKSHVCLSRRHSDSSQMLFRSRRTCAESCKHDTSKRRVMLKRCDVAVAAAKGQDDAMSDSGTRAARSHSFSLYPQQDLRDSVAAEDEFSETYSGDEEEGAEYAACVRETCAAMSELEQSMHEHARTTQAPRRAVQEAHTHDINSDYNDYDNNNKHDCLKSGNDDDDSNYYYHSFHYSDTSDVMDDANIARQSSPSGCIDADMLHDPSAVEESMQEINTQADYTSASAVWLDDHVSHTCSSFVPGVHSMLPRST